jgi:HAD superfamily hydrolase (TIGR01509 family)
MEFRLIKAIIFDMDGVVLDSEKLYAKGGIELFREYGVEIPDEDWKLYRGCSEKRFYDISMERYNITENREIFMAKGRRKISEVFEQELDFMDGFKEFIKRIPHLQIALVTSTRDDLFEWMDGKLDIRDMFSYVITGDMVKNPKPHPEPFLKMIEKLGIEPSECIVVEDSVHGINSGMASGAYVVALEGSLHRSDMPKSHKIISHFDEFTSELIESFNE